jgi:glycerol-3-phosphate responsive antiterminator
LPDLAHLPLILAACDGRADWDAPPELDVGLLLRDTDLDVLIHRSMASVRPVAVDMDTIAGLGADESAVAFVVRTLGIGIVLTRRPQLAACAAELGGLGLLQVMAFDSTGLLRSLASHPRAPRVGTAVSPGLVLPHLRREEIAQLPRPILAYGLIESREAARAVIGCADSLAVRPATADAIAHDFAQSIGEAAPSLHLATTLMHPG